MSRSHPLRNVTVVITRPAGTAGPLARRVRKLGGIPVSVPGLSLRATEDATAVDASLRRALEGDVLVFHRGVPASVAQVYRDVNSATSSLNLQGG